MPHATRQDVPEADGPQCFMSAPFSSVLEGASCPVFHGFFGRGGGRSTGIYGTLNCGIGSEDDPDAVAYNRRVVAEAAGCAPDNLLSLYQIHSEKCVSVSTPWALEDRPQADAMVTDRAGIALGILTADCAPVLFYGQKPDGAPVIGAAHAGWGGALKGVLESTLREMLALGTQKETLAACIGPCIGQASYEVTQDFAVPFAEEDAQASRFFIEGQRDGALLFDLAGYCAFRLARAGVGSVFVKELDTYFNETDFFSYRRTTHRKETDYGRQISVIAIAAD